MSRSARRLTLMLLVAAAVGVAPHGVAAQASPSRSDSLLASRVEAAIRAASDVPADSINVSVRGGVVTLIGSVICADCGGTRTPSGTGTVQQSLGAVVRAVPGVDQVRFDLVYRRP
ncbi:MAG: BON domain-containing protein [Gemmatimonadota bacterium]|nr:BON domain-containing protein [Gemmatimonadota bacterium]MDH3421812.1 BON domain-containing protein [Gemmatimonadota bacterium]